MSIRPHLAAFVAAILLFLGWVEPSPAQQETPPAPTGTYRPGTGYFGGLSLPSLGSHSEPPDAAIGQMSVPQHPAARLISVHKIWDKAAHNGFTDLIRFRERWYCALREGSQRVSADGGVRVISSADGEYWSSAFFYSQPEDGFDLRDPKLSITGDGRLMLSAGAVQRSEDPPIYRTVTWFSADGRNWGEPFRIGDFGTWLWRVTWYRGSAYSLGYQTSGERFLRMYVGPGGSRFQPFDVKAYEEATPTEASLLFANDNSAIALVRRDAAPGTAVVGHSIPAYRVWHWQDTGVRLTGPDLLRLPDGRIVAAGEVPDPEPHTEIFFLDAENAKLREIFSLPSGGDNGYPGLDFYDDLLWVSYHSSHEGSTAVYLAKLKLPEPEPETEQ